MWQKEIDYATETIFCFQEIRPQDYSGLGFFYLWKREDLWFAGAKWCW